MYQQEIKKYAKDVRRQYNAVLKNNKQKYSMEQDEDYLKKAIRMYQLELYGILF